MEQPSIHLFGFLFHEPITAVTNLVLCVCALLFAYKVGKSYAKYWSYFFYAIAVATFFAAFGHSLYSDKNNILQLISRMSNVMSVFLCCMASSFFILNRNFQYLFKALTIGLTVIFLSLLLKNNSFEYVKWDAIIGLGIMTGGINLYLALIKNKGGLFILLGILISASTAYIYSKKVSLSEWFNHNDISHIILILGFYLMAHGAIKLQDYANT
jgi:hypothetical protein